MLVALAAGFFPLLLGEPPFTHQPGPGEDVVKIGTLELITAVLFDIGVFLLVTGVLVILVHHLTRLVEKGPRMKLVFALVIAVLFGTGAYLLLNRDLVRVVLGIVVISQASVLTLMASSLSRGSAAIYPLRGASATRSARPWPSPPSSSASP